MVGARSRTPTLRDSLSEPGCPFAADSKDAADRSGAPRLTAPSRPEVGRPEHRFRFLTLNEVAERLSVSSRTVRHRIPLGLVGQWGCPGVGEGKIGDQPLEPGTPAVRRRERRCRIESISVDFTLLGPRMNLPAASP
jgi:hypothetical protein